MCQTATKVILIKNWDDFEENIVKGTEADYQEFKKDKQRFSVVSRPLFRGQANADWKLETTLERFLSKNITLEEYYHVIRCIKPIIESCTSSRWQLPKWEKFTLPYATSKTLPYYEFITYLRHNQFPSPLLDWTQSPYLAAFFAFIEDRKTNSAIYTFMEYAGQGKNGLSSEPMIWSVGNTITTHKRHHLQQSQYTFCVIGVRPEYKYASHEEAFSLQETDGEMKQDILKKYILPYSQRKYFLEKLNQRNINAYSLFGSEEGLMHKLAIEELLLKAGKGEKTE